jgi:hypothetical protein
MLVLININNYHTKLSPLSISIIYYFIINMTRSRKKIRTRKEDDKKKCKSEKCNCNKNNYKNYPNSDQYPSFQGPRIRRRRKNELGSVGGCNDDASCCAQYCGSDQECYIGCIYS